MAQSNPGQQPSGTAEPEVTAPATLPKWKTNCASILLWPSRAS